MYLGEREHNDPELVTASHLRMLESLLGRYQKKTKYLHKCNKIFLKLININITITGLWKYDCSKKDASESIVHSYRQGFSGFAAHLTDSQAKKIAGAHLKKCILL